MVHSRSKIAVVGSINMDLVVRCSKLPVAGQTILADSCHELCGGKGANQAVASAQVGGAVTMLGRVGDDVFADRLVNNLAAGGVSVDQVLRTSNSASGVAIVAVDQTGQNSIMVVPGANGRVTPTDVESARGMLEASDAILLQLEIPMDSVLATLRIAKAAGVRTILDPAPAPDNWPAELFTADLLCPNESEAAALVGHAVESLEDAASAAKAIHSKGSPHVVITLGDKGAVLFDGSAVRHVSPFDVDAVDSTAAGDAFAGALAVRWTETNDVVEAIQFGNAAGAMAASKHGTQQSMASRQEIMSLRSAGSSTE